MNDPQSFVFIVDDDRIILESLAEMLRLEGYDVDGAANMNDAIVALESKHADVVICDINMPDGDGFEMLRVIRQRWPAVVVVMITGYGTIESAVEAIKMGAYDYLTKPLKDDEIRFVVERALSQQALLRENRTLKQQLDERYGLDSIVGHDYKMLKIFDLVEAVADSKVTVLIQGESGTGKSLVARCIHRLSERRDKPFVEVACGAIPETLLESELFGHVKGAFTGAVNDKMGRFKAADGGTLFLDEIATASPALQVKLLRAIQERQFEPVGSMQTQTVDVRLILATNKDLEEEVEAGRFRHDLFYRINVVTMTLPRLAERIGDIPRLAEHFLAHYSEQSPKKLLGFTPEALDALQRYNWPGNVRELENIVERAVVLSKGSYVTPDDLPPKLLDRSMTMPLTCGEFTSMPLRKAIEGPEKAIIEAALRANDWNRQATADVLEINRTTLYKKMKRYGLDAEPAGAHS